MTRRPPRFPVPELGRLLQVWLAQHLQALLSSLGQALRAPISSLLTTAVIGISLALPAGFYLLLDNAGTVVSAWGNSAQLALFLRLEVGDQRARELAAAIAARPDVATAAAVSRAEVLEEYRRLSGFGAALDALPDNPLPALILVQPRGAAADAGAALLAELQHLPEVDAAQFDRQWVQRLAAIMAILKRTVLILGALLSLGVLLIVGNTIRLAIHHRRAEIEINMLFGATHGFIQRPFLYTGLLHGLAGALFAWLLVNGALRILAGPVDRLAELYQSGFTLSGLGGQELLVLLCAGAALGIIGSWVSVQRHLRSINPF
jgi:cell division transport system permease protein